MELGPVEERIRWLGEDGHDAPAFTWTVAVNRLDLALNLKSRSDEHPRCLPPVGQVFATREPFRSKTILAFDRMCCVLLQGIALHICWKILRLAC